jgi:hypothetical protein
MRRLGRLSKPFGRGGDDRPPAPFVVGLTRSGTTLLRMMLDAHPELTVPPETHFVPDLIKAARERGADAERLHAAVVSHRTWGDFALDSDELLERLRAIDPNDPGEAVRAFFDLYAERAGKPRWGDKTPAYMLAIRRIGRALQEARFVHLIRDGRDVALSQTARGINEQPPVREQAERWQGRIRKARDQAAELGADRYRELRYEDLVREPEAALRAVCGLCDLPFDTAMLTYHERAAERLEEMAGELPAVGAHAAQPAGYRLANHAPTTKPPDPAKLEKWRREMPAPDLAAYEEVAGEMLAELGYEVSS